MQVQKEAKSLDIYFLFCYTTEGQTFDIFKQKVVFFQKVPFIFQISKKKKYSKKLSCT